MIQETPDVSEQLVRLLIAAVLLSGRRPSILDAHAQLADRRRGQLHDLRQVSVTPGPRPGPVFLKQTKGCGALLRQAHGLGRDGGPLDRFTKQSMDKGLWVQHLQNSTHCPHGVERCKTVPAINKEVVLFYVKSALAPFNVLRRPLDPEYVKKVCSRVDENGRRYRLDNISAPGGRGPIYEWGGITQPWRYTKENMERLYGEGRIRMYPDGRAMINAYVRYLDENEGQPVQDWWDDLGVIAAPAKERLGYPTQKPEVLLERMIRASSNEGDIILDPFCGCGTAIAVAQRLDRRWIGIDVTHLAINLIKTRLQDAYGDQATYRVIGEPTTVEDAEDLAKTDPYQFQWWALGLVGARAAEQKKGADKGIDGRIYFHDDSSGKTKQVILSVKAGHTSVPHVRDLRGVIDREKAAIGVLITFQQSTQPMRTEAASAGFYDSPGWGKGYPRLQLLTVGELLQGQTIDMPPLHQVNQTFRKAPRAATTGSTQSQLSLVAESSSPYAFDDPEES